MSLHSHAVQITAVALLLMVPAVFSSPMTHDSFWITWVWADQFIDELASGNLYPRWLPNSHGGLGSPVFFYYPPLAFYLTGLFGLAGLATYPAIVATFFVGLLSSGFAMYAWLKDTAKAPLAGALVYMAAPYHLLDFYGRGALAEFLAIALIPLIALGLRRAIDGRIGLAAVSFAALILTHVPLALLVGVFFAAPYVLYLSGRSWRMLFRCGCALLLGIAISAIYLLPALALEPFRDSAQLWTDAHLKPENWSILSSVPGPSPGMRAVFVAILLALVPPILLLIFSAAGRAAGVYSAACWIIAAGLIPGLWSLPLIEAVQFPFRLFPLLEFGIATGFAHVGFSRLTAWLAASPGIALSAFVLAILDERGRFTISNLAASHPDVPENLPPGDRPFSWPSKWALRLATAHQQPRQVAGYSVEPVFYFPSWEVECQGRKTATFPEPRTKLLMYKGAGCERGLAATEFEKAGGGISLLALLVLLLVVRGGRGRAAVRQHRRASWCARFNTDRSTRMPAIELERTL